MDNIQLAVDFLKQTGKYQVYAAPVSQSSNWAVVDLTSESHFATMYSNQQLLDLAISQGFVV
jgi:3-methyladenine DNA glycosylase AlkD